MEATLSQHHHLYSKPFSHSTKSTTINPSLSFSLHHHSSLFSCIRLHATPVQRRLSMPHLLNSLPVPGEAGTDGNMGPKRPMEKSPSMRSLSLASLRSGMVVLKGMMLEAKRALLDPNLLDNAEMEFVSLLKEEQINWYNLQRVIWKLEMSGKEDKAVQMLKERYIKEVKGRHAYEAYELGLLLVEMMIYQGNYRSARRLCTALFKDRPPNDARPPLYLAVTNVMLGSFKEAREKWVQFTEIQSLHGMEPEPTMTEESPGEDNSTLTFEQFKLQMEVLKQEIADARK